MPEKQIPRAALVGQLTYGLELLGQEVEAHPVDAYLDYIQLLVKWNQAYNLSGIKSAEKMISHHVLDSLSVLPYIQGDSCLDVGTGAGLPGFILALADPSRPWVLLDSNKKKVRFLRQLVLELQPGNVEIVDSRVEEFAPECGFSAIISRAMSSFSNLKQAVSHLIGSETVLIAMKGELLGEEQQSIKADPGSLSIKRLQVPGIDSERNLVIQSHLTV